MMSLKKVQHSKWSFLMPKWKYVCNNQHFYEYLQFVNGCGDVMRAFALSCKQIQQMYLLKQHLLVILCGRREDQSKFHHIKYK